MSERWRDSARERSPRGVGVGAGEGNRTPVHGLEGRCITTMLLPLRGAGN